MRSILGSVYGRERRERGRGRDMGRGIPGCLGGDVYLSRYYTLFAIDVSNKQGKITVEVRKNEQQFSPNSALVCLDVAFV